MKKWNVLHIFYHYPPVITGYSKRSHEIIKHTSSFSNPVIITPPIDTSKISLNGTPDKGFGEEIYRLIKIPLPPIKHIGHRLANRLMLEFLIRTVFKRHHFDIVHAHMPYMYALPVMKYARKKGIKCIYEVRGVWEDSAVAEKKITRDSKKYLSRRRGEEITMNLADKIVVLSKPLYDELRKRGIPENKLETVGNAVDCSTFKPQPHSSRLEVLYHLKGKFVIGYIGTLRKMEGLQTIIRLLPQLKKKDDQIVFLIIGHGEYKSELKKLVSDLDLENMVSFAGTIPADQIPNFYSVMDCIVFPRESHRVTELVSPLKPLEAMAMEKPILASNVGGLTDYCIDQVNSILFDPNDPEDCLEKLDKLIHDKSLRNNISKSACDWVRQNRDWKEIAKKYQTIYEQLTG